ncbi:MAG: hypothetical protein GQ522_00080 [Deltaproteobacteria bacterium]|nr:hypothetical protein [Deltaproteobacteria bacterium]
MSIDSTIENQGTSNSTGFYVHYYLSTDTIYNAGDVPIGHRQIANGITAGGSDVDTSSVYVPANTTAGTYYVIVLADSGNTVLESSETNNTGVSGAVTVSP